MAATATRRRSTSRAAAAPIPQPAQPEQTFKPSDYQRAILDWIARGTGNGIVAAVAGSGKTTTLKEAARLIQNEALFIAFNRHIVEELTRKLRGTSMTAKTIHGVGYGLVSQYVGGKKLNVDDRKYYKLARDYGAQHEHELLRIGYDIPLDLADEQIAPDLRRRMNETLASGELAAWGKQVSRLLPRLAGFARLTLTDPHDGAALAALMTRFDLLGDIPAIERAAVAWLPAILEAAQEQALREAIVDWTDMLWLPNVWPVPIRRLPWVLVDEAQDLSAAARELALKLVAPRGRMLFVGDPDQAIMGFAGADTASFWTIKERTQARQMPLSICYRCPSSHIELARQYVPDIEARPDAPIGSIETVSEQQARQMIQPGDMVLCRLTAPLVAECIRLITNHIPARVRGQAVGEQLAEMVLAVTKLIGYRWANFGEYLAELTEIQRRKLMQREASESQLDALTDREEAIRICYENWHCHSAEDLAEQIKSLFSDKQIGVTLSTVHRAKGLENPRVFILRPDKLPLSRPKQTPEEAQQERNLAYVAYTRATEALFFIEHEPAVAAVQSKLI